jgi:hypothetical protein
MEKAGNTNLDTRCDNYKERKKESKKERKKRKKGRNGRIRVSFNIQPAMKAQKVSRGITVLFL